MTGKEMENRQPETGNLELDNRRSAVDGFPVSGIRFPVFNFSRASAHAS